LKKVTDANWNVISDHKYKHHFLFEVKNENFNRELTNNSGGDEEDFMDLSGL
jgi:hypothetical protein